MKKVVNHPKREKRLDWYDLPKGFKGIRAEHLKEGQFFFFHMTGQRRVADKVKYDILVEITSTLSSGRQTTHAVHRDKNIIVYK